MCKWQGFTIIPCFFLAYFRNNPYLCRPMMKRWLIPIVITLLAVLSNWQGGDIQRGQNPGQTTSALIITPQDQRHHEATLTDATSLYRVCNTRPQRIMPTYGSKSERSVSQFRLLMQRHIVKPLSLLHDSRRRLETAPFCLSASCHYYVLALRHILR